jgi:hypothetical protein
MYAAEAADCEALEKIIVTRTNPWPLVDSIASSLALLSDSTGDWQGLAPPRRSIDPDLCLTEVGLLPARGKLGLHSTYKQAADDLRMVRQKVAWDTSGAHPYLSFQYTYRNRGTRTLVAAQLVAMLMIRRADSEPVGIAWSDVRHFALVEGDTITVNGEVRWTASRDVMPQFERLLTARAANNTDWIAR